MVPSVNTLFYTSDAKGLLQKTMALNVNILLTMIDGLKNI